MHSVSLHPNSEKAGFRHAVRRMLAAEATPETILWNKGGGLFGDDATPAAPPVMLPRAIGDIVTTILCHGDPERFALLYALIWRARHGEPAILEKTADPLVHRLSIMRKSIGRDLHKMHAFLRFKLVETSGPQEKFAAWFEPEHNILDLAAEFFTTRFAALEWSIFTPFGSLHWDRQHLIKGPPGHPSDAPAGDDFEDGWRGYYESIFNPTRLNPTAMRAEMPKKYWRNLPEARAIPALIRAAPGRTREMVEQEPSMPIKKDPIRAVAAMQTQTPATLADLNRIIAATPPLVPGATQVVLGEGPQHAAIVLVGEQPGDAEDLAGRPFVGPAGQLLDRALHEAGLDRSDIYVTNAVKHFKFEMRGKRRLHSKPTAGEIKHYRWWLMKELELVQPRLVVALGATALQALSGEALPLMASRGEMPLAEWSGFVTVHPSYLLRLPDEASRQNAYKEFVADFRQIRKISAA